MIYIELVDVSVVAVWRGGDSDGDSDGVWLSW